MSSLKELCIIEYGKALPERNRKIGNVHVYGSAGKVGLHSESLYNEPIIVVGRKGNISDVHKVLNPSWVIDTAYAIRAGEQLTFEYLYYFLKFKSSHFSQSDQSTAIPSLSRDFLYSLEIEPIKKSIQIKIVKKIETLFSEIDAGVEDLKKTSEKLELYKQSVLNAAIRGKLVPQDPKDEPASKLLERISAEKEKLVKEGKIKKEKHLPPIDPSEIPFELPKGWEWVRLGDVIEVMNQGWSPKCENYPSKNENTWGVIKTSSIQSMKFIDDENKELPKNLQPRSQHEIQVGDILITRAGPRVRVGVCCLVKKTRKKLLLCDKAYRLKVNPKFVLPEYIELILNAPTIQRILEKMKSGISDSGLNLNQTGVLDLLIPFCSIKAQADVVNGIGLVFDFIKEFEIELHGSIENNRILKQSILKQAFEGKLI